MGNTRYHTKDNGQSYAELEYDIWGNPTSPNMLINNDNGVFIFATFTGHIYNTVLDIYFAEARFYDAKNRQWMNSDPMKDGLNWYQYVRANPVTFFDPSGLELIVVSGGNSSSEGFQYNFIETAIKCIIDWKANYPEKNITWIIADWNYTSNDLKNFKKTADYYGVHLEVINNKSQMINYINTKNSTEKERRKDPVEEMAFFAHGSAFDVPFTVPNPDYKNKYALTFGYSTDGPHNNDLNFFVDDIAKLKEYAFAPSYFTYFGACRTGAEFDGKIFAQEWVNHTGGIALAPTVRTQYYNIYPDERTFGDKVYDRTLAHVLGRELTEREKAREETGYAQGGAKNYPDLVDNENGEWVIFYSNKLVH